GIAVRPEGDGSIHDRDCDVVASGRRFVRGVPAGAARSESRSNGRAAQRVRGADPWADPLVCTGPLVLHVPGTYEIFEAKADQGIGRRPGGLPPCATYSLSLTLMLVLGGNISGRIPPASVFSSRSSSSSTSIS